MVLRGAILIDGTGAPPKGPMDIVIEGDRIVSIRSAGPPNTRLPDARPPKDADFEIDCAGMYVLPGFIDMHAHSGEGSKASSVEYCFKLWLAHGVTTLRGVPLGPNDWVVEHRERSRRNEIVAPNIVNYQRPGSVRTPEAARAWVRSASGRGIEGLKLGSYEPDVMAALLDEAARQGLGSVAHLNQEGVAQMNALDAARLGLDSVTHYYGHFEALLKDHQLQPWPVDQNQADEQHRFAEVARLVQYIHEPGSPEWDAYLREHIELGTVFDPTLNIYSAGRDVMRARNADWHARYSLPSLLEFFEPSRHNHGSYFFDWTTADEIAWRNFYQVWFRLLRDYNRMGGRITTGSDPGFIYQTWGFSYITELEMLQEAGLHPLEVIRCATMNGALTLHEPRSLSLDYGVVKEGLRADLIVVEGNPLANLKILYGTGHMMLDDDTGQVSWQRGIRWTVKSGVAYEVDLLLEDVSRMVEAQRREREADVLPSEAGG